jgi:hypothetical protein
VHSQNWLCHKSKIVLAANQQHVYHGNFQVDSGRRDAGWIAVRFCAADRM